MNIKKTGLLTGICLVFVLVAQLLMVACAGPAPSPTPSPTAPPIATPKPTATPSPTASPQPTAAPIKPIELRLSSQVAPQSSAGRNLTTWAGRVAEQSGGKLKIQLYFVESLAKASEVYRAMQTGVADIGYTTIGNDVSLTPLSTVTRLPFLGLPSPSAANSIQWELFNKFPEIQKEWQGMKPLAIAALPADQLHFTKKEVRAPADIKGMKIIARGEWPTVVKNMGASPVDLGVGDWYVSLDRGLVEGQIVPFVAANAFKLLDLLKYHTLLGEGGCSTTLQIVLVNLEKFNSLPPDLQKVLVDTGKVLGDEMTKTDVAETQTIIDACKAKNQSLINLKPEEIQPWLDAGKPRQDSWITDNTAKGLPAKAVYDETLRLIKQYAK